MTESEYRESRSLTLSKSEMIFYFVLEIKMRKKRSERDIFGCTNRL